MGNKVKYNLKNVHAAKLTEMADDGGSSVFAYATPQAIPGTVRRVHRMRWGYRP